jgi:regulator of protease activity HflC (stomatin/prohibitin superfamily)
MGNIPVATPLFEDSPAYVVLSGNNLLETKYRVRDASEITAREANSDAWAPCCYSTASCFLPPCIGWCIYKAVAKTFEVPSGKLRRLEDGRGNYEFAGPGIHLILDPFVREVGEIDLGEDELQISHGDRSLVVIAQGKLGFAWDMGQPVLLPPGLHQWKSTTLRFEKSVDLNNNIVNLGPYTLVTVDEGYSAVTQDNGRQVILGGGTVHLLTHRNWKFEKFISQKIQTNNLEEIKATSADNILLTVNSTVNWRVEDVAIAARMSAETMSHDGRDVKGANRDITKLRSDVLKQAEASLASFIGSMNYSDTLHVSAANTLKAQASTSASSGAGSAYSPIFDVTRMTSAVDHANDITMKYGVKIISINIISATPADHNLRNSLAQGAVAAAEAQQAETAAEGQAKALQIASQGEAQAAVLRAHGLAEAAVIEAKACADAEMIRAEGAKKAADTLESSSVAVDLAKIEKTGVALGGNSSFFFGQDPTALGSLLAYSKAAK